MRLEICQNLSNVPAGEWDALAGDTNPFVSHSFLNGLEQHGCLDPHGWHPHHLLIYDDNTLVGALPGYIKTNAYGEFVFDFAWSDAYERTGLDYYPKLVHAIPFTPATGPRLLTHPDRNRGDIAKMLIQFSISVCEKIGLSSSHWLFPQQQDMYAFKQGDLLHRYDYQFHWHNHDYSNFNDFLGSMSSKKRKNINQERRKVRESGIKIDTLPGASLDKNMWITLYDFYRLTFERKWGSATLTLDFFKTIKDSLVFFYAHMGDEPVAGAICIRGKNTLYGRHWGCYQTYDCLHFEVCYYQGIEYCINEGLQTFEPGAQGEHKISRGFLPTKTHSYHWIKNRDFRNAIREFLIREDRALQDYYISLGESSPYKKNTVKENNK